MLRNGTLSQQRRISVLDAQAAKEIALSWLARSELERAASFGLPEEEP